MQKIRTGISLTPKNLDRAKELAAEAGCNRNQLIGLLIESARIVEPVLPVDATITKREVQHNDTRV